MSSKISKVPVIGSGPIVTGQASSAVYKYKQEKKEAR